MNGLPSSSKPGLSRPLRWIVLRVCDANPQCLTKVLELARELLDLLYDEARAQPRTLKGGWGT